MALGVIVAVTSPQIIDVLVGSKKLIGADGTVYIVDPPGMTSKVLLVVTAGLLLFGLGVALKRRSGRSAS